MSRWSSTSVRRRTHGGVLGQPDRSRCRSTTSARWRRHRRHGRQPVLGIPGRRDRRRGRRRQTDLPIGSDGVAGRFFDETRRGRCRVPAPSSVGGDDLGHAGRGSGHGARRRTDLRLTPATPAGGAATTVSVGTVSATGTVNAPLTGLAPGTIYCFQAVVTNVFGTTRSRSSAGTLALPTPRPAADRQRPHAADGDRDEAVVPAPGQEGVCQPSSEPCRVEDAAWRRERSGPGSQRRARGRAPAGALARPWTCVAYQSGKLHRETCAKARTLWTPGVVKSTAWSLHVSSKLPLGAWTLQVRAVDRAGNAASAPTRRRSASRTDHGLARPGESPVSAAHAPSPR